MDDRICPVCGEAFTQKRPHGKPQRYCSKVCYSSAATVRRREQRVFKTASCEICGGHIARVKGRRNFCSDVCRKEERRRRSARRYAADPEAHRAKVRRTYHRQGSQAWERYRTNRRIPIEFRRLTTPNKIAARFAYWGNRCWVCGAADGPLEKDHVKPLSKGGLHLASNIRPICGRCNRSKRDRWPFLLTT